MSGKVLVSQAHEAAVPAQPSRVAYVKDSSGVNKPVTLPAVEERPEGPPMVLLMVLVPGNRVMLEPDEAEKCADQLRFHAESCRVQGRALAEGIGDHASAGGSAMKPIDLKAIRARVQRVSPHCTCCPATPSERKLAHEDVPALLDLAELQTRALVAEEWEGTFVPPAGPSWRCCPTCQAPAPSATWYHALGYDRAGEHKPDCLRHVALLLAGLPDQASRNAERARRVDAG